MQILEIGSGEMSQPRRKVAPSFPLERSETRKKKKSSSVLRVESRQHLRTAATRKALLEAAMNVFVRDGFEASCIEDIAAEAGRSRGAFYVNFSNKAEAFFALREQRFLSNEARFRKKLQGQTPLEEQRQAVEEYMVEQVLDKSYTLLELEFKLFAIFKTSYQCDIGCEPKISSSIAVSCGRFCSSWAGFENRGSVRISSRPSAFRTAGTLSGVATKTNQVPSEERYVFKPTFSGCARSCNP